MGLIADIRIPGEPPSFSAKLVKAVHALMDFLYLTKYPIHTSETLDAMDMALQEFHSNIDVFVTIGIRSHCDMPKIHFMGHYRYFIEQFGMADNFNTEYTERLHIDMAKNAYRATNKKDEYPQMMAWLACHEKVMHHEKYIRRCLLSLAETPEISHSQIVRPAPCLIPRRSQHMSKHPSVRAVTFQVLREKYGTHQFEATLARFIVQYQHPSYTKHQIDNEAPSLHIPFYKVSIYHRLKFVSQDIYALDPLAAHVVNSIHVEPVRLDKNNKAILGRFDIALFKTSEGSETGVKGSHILYCERH